VVVLELPPAQLAIALRRGELERLVVGHGRVEVDGLLLVVGGLVLHLGDLTGDRVDHDLVIGGTVQDLDVPLPGPGVLVVVGLGRVQRALPDLGVRGGAGVLRLGGRGVGAQIGARAVVAGAAGGVSPVVGPAVIAHAAAVAGTAVITGLAVVARFGGRGVPARAVVGLIGRAAASHRAERQDAARGHQGTPLPGCASSLHRAHLSTCSVIGQIRDAGPLHG